MVADRILQHRELGYQVVGFVDDRAGGDHIGYRGLPLLGTLAEVGDIAQREKVDHLYVALPLEEHAKLLDLMELTSRECIDVKVVPDLLQFIALRARLEDLDGLPIINVNDVPLQGFNAWVKRALDVVLSLAAMVVLAIPMAIIAAAREAELARSGLLPRRSAWGSTARRSPSTSSARCTVDAEDSTGPIWARDDDPRATPVGRWLRRFDLDELPQFWNVLKGDMSIVGPRPERPFFVEQFKHRIPQYMLRHKVKAGITGWAQVNGWRGNTSLEKRIEYDLYYIENWSVTLDLKIMWLTLVRGLFQSHTCLEQSSPAQPASSARISAKPCSTAATRSSASTTCSPATCQHRPSARPGFRVHPSRRHALHRRRRPGRFRAALGQPGQPDRLPRAADPDAEGRLARHAQRARPGKAKSARFVLASTSEVYGDPLEHPQKETYWGNVNPIGPRGVYDEAKRFAEAITLAYHRYHGLDTKIVRIFNTYGPRMRLRDGRAVPAFMSQALRNEDVTVFGDGTQTRSFCYVSDLVDGILRLMDPRPTSPVNIGNPHEVTIEEIARTIIALVGSHEPDRLPAAARGRPETAAARHHPRRDDPRLGAEGRSRRGAAEDGRLLQGEAGGGGVTVARSSFAVNQPPDPQEVVRRSRRPSAPAPPRSSRRQPATTSRVAS